MVQSTPPDAYIYIRMSTEKQKQGDSYRRQRALTESYALKYGLNLQPQVYEDIGVSAFTGTHLKFGALGRFQSDVENGLITRGSYLLVESLDRISREGVTVALSKFLGFLSAGIVLVTVSDGAKYSEEGMAGGGAALGPLFMSLGVMARAHEESLIKSQRIGEAWANKRANAATKKLTKTAPSWLLLSADRNHFEIIPERATLVRQMFEDCEHGIGTNKIARRLNQQKVPIWGKSQCWQQSYIKKILTNRAVIGEYQPYENRGGVLRRSNI